MKWRFYAFVTIFFYMTQLCGDKIDRKTAWIFLFINLIFPGLGSILGKKKVGIIQIILSGISLLILYYYLVKLGQWIFANRDEILFSGRFSEISPEMMSKIWEFLKYMIIAIAMFVVSLCWSVYTSYLIIKESGDEKHS